MAGGSEFKTGEEMEKPSTDWRFEEIVIMFMNDVCGAVDVLCQ
jgi:hypothetical protein